ncbi:Uncharacterized protein GBIM_07514, partial [Gryllus bimaculatus]
MRESFHLFINLASIPFPVRLVERVQKARCGCRARGGARAGRARVERLAAGLPDLRPPPRGRRGARAGPPRAGLRCLRLAQPRRRLVQKRYHQYQSKECILEWFPPLRGTPPIDVVWLKDGAELPDCDDFRYVDYGDGRVGLRFADVFEQDSGDYSCEAFSAHGDAATVGRLLVQESSSAEEAG